MVVGALLLCVALCCWLCVLCGCVSCSCGVFVVRWYERADGVMPVSGYSSSLRIELAMIWSLSKMCFP